MNTTRIPGLPSFIKKNPDTSTIEGLMDKLSDAAILIRVDRENIILSNAKASELTSYTRDEIRDKNIRNLLPNLADLSLLVAQQNVKNSDTVLILRSGKQIVVDFETTCLDQNQNLLLLTITKPESIKKTNINIELTHQRLEALKILTQAIINSDQKAGFTLILQAGLVLTGGNLTAVYLPMQTEDTLSLYSGWGNIELIPDHLAFNELESLRILNIWKPGSRVLSDLHRAALANKMNYVACIPIDENEPRNGILVLSGQNETEQIQLTNDILIISSALYACMNNNTMINKLEDGIKVFTSSQNASQIIENVITEGLITTSPDLKILNMNKMVEKTLGYRSDEVINQHLNQVLIGPDSLMPSLEGISTNSGLQDIGKVKLHRRNGQSVFVHLRAIPMVENDRLIKIAILISDLSQYEEYITRTRQLEQQAFVGEVTAIFAHEVRNPINNISTGLQLMALKNPENDALQQQIKILKQDCARLEELMKSVLSVSKSRDFNIEPINFKYYIKSVIERLQPRFSRYNVDCTLHIDKDIPEIMGDQNALEQVFTNLISNALEAMKNQNDSILAIKAHLKMDSDGKPYVEINISDNGPGIPPEIQERIFEPFFTTNEKGTGLGLAISKRIITAHNGKISLSSFPGGTVFKITLPAVIS